MGASASKRSTILPYWLSHFTCSLSRLQHKAYPQLLLYAKQNATMEAQATHKHCLQTSSTCTHILHQAKISHSHTHSHTRTNRLSNRLPHKLTCPQSSHTCYIHTYINTCCIYMYVCTVCISRRRM